MKSWREPSEGLFQGELGAANGDERKALIDHHLAALDGPLACERIVDVLEKAIDELKMSPQPPIRDRFNGWFKTTKRRIRQRYKSYLPGSLKSPEFERHRYPPVDAGEISARLARFQQILGYGTDLKVEPIFSKLFRISA